MDESRKFFCKKCDFSSIKLEDLGNHVIEKHISANRKFKCDEANCNFKASSEKQLQSHKNFRHTPVEKFECHMCSEFKARYVV